MWWQSFFKIDLAIYITESEIFFGGRHFANIHDHP